MYVGGWKKSASHVRDLPMNHSLFVCVHTCQLHMMINQPDSLLSFARCVRTVLFVNFPIYIFFAFRIQLFLRCFFFRCVCWFPMSASSFKMHTTRMSTIKIMLVKRHTVCSCQLQEYTKQILISVWVFVRILHFVLNFEFRQKYESSKKDTTNQQNERCWFSSQQKMQFK